MERSRRDTISKKKQAEARLAALDSQLASGKKRLDVFEVEEEEQVYEVVRLLSLLSPSFRARERVLWAYDVGEHVDNASLRLHPLSLACSSTRRRTVDSCPRGARSSAVSSSGRRTPSA